MYNAILFIGLSVILSGVGFEDVGTKPRGEGITTVFTREGENATLPCHLSDLNLKDQVFDWKKDRQEVFFYENGRDYTNGKEGQNRQFKGRVSLAPGGLQAGNASVILSNVTEKDFGEYKCLFLTHNKKEWIQLTKVVDPQLSLTIEEAPLSSGWVRLSCVSTGGHPEPRGLEWHNKDEAVNKTRNSTYISGRYHLQLDLIVTEPGNYTCLALQGDVKPARGTIQLPGNWQKSDCCFESVIIALFLILVVVCIIIDFKNDYFKPNPCGIHLCINRDGLESVTEDPDLNVKK